MPEYIVGINGGEGPDVWDREFVIIADSIREALDQAEPIAQEESGVVNSISFSQ